MISAKVTEGDFSVSLSRFDTGISLKGYDIDLPSLWLTAFDEIKQIKQFFNTNTTFIG